MSFQSTFGNEASRAKKSFVSWVALATGIKLENTPIRETDTNENERARARPERDDLLELGP